MRWFILWGCESGSGQLPCSAVRWLADSTGKSGSMILFYLLTIPIVAAITLPLYRSKHGAGLNLPAAAVAVPGMLLDIISLNWYSSLFPSMPLTYAPPSPAGSCGLTDSFC
ncbi:hypothetical protein ABD76_06600 [Paenibacillus dendritiformis]|uniref:DUF5367 family protein n=1 Tax=Paenibacillus dendritiformis TaxID=130049 RepID=UPI0018CE0D91|nr:DUF5367 family protein [Paenibacillus dendritiformis]MBG9792179.1 hypothetical protein [Paenibacillus dendritiformis]